MLTTGPVAVTTPVELPARLIAWDPTFPATQDTPAPRVAAWPLPEESAAIVPVPSSKAQYAAGEGTVGMLPEISVRTSSDSTIHPAA